MASQLATVVHARPALVMQAKLQKPRAKTLCRAGDNHVRDWGVSPQMQGANLSLDWDNADFPCYGSIDAETARQSMLSVDLWLTEAPPAPTQEERATYMHCWQYSEDPSFGAEVARNSMESEDLYID